MQIIVKKALTRQQHKDEAKRKRNQRKIDIQVKVQRFTNPCLTYRLADNFFIQEVEGRPIISFDNLFLWNRITTATIKPDRIVLNLSSVTPELQLPPKYVIERFRSFGKQDLNEFCIKLQRLLAIGQTYPKQITDQFITHQQMIPKALNKCWFAMVGDYKMGVPRHSRFEISTEFCHLLGFTGEQMGTLAVKTGCLPFHVRSTNELYNEKCVNLLNLMLMYHTMAMHKNHQAIRHLANISATPQMVQIETFLNTTGTCSFKLLFASPTDALLMVDKVQMREIEPRAHFQNLLEEDEYDCLSKLIKVPETSRKIYKPKACKFRFLDRP